MDAVIEAVLVKRHSGFSVNHKVAAFMRNYFVRQDGTLTSFIRALKIACVQHFSMEPLSFLMDGLFLEEDGKALKDKQWQEEIVKNAWNLPSCARSKMVELNGNSFHRGLSKLKRLQNHWGTIVLCLYEAGKQEKIRLLDLLCEALDPEPYNSRLSEAHTKLDNYHVASTRNLLHQEYPLFRKGGLIWHAVCKIRDLPIAQLHKLLKRWEELAVDISEVAEKLKELLTMFKFEDGKVSGKTMANISKRRPSRSQLAIEDTREVNEKAVILIESMVRDFMVPTECVPLHEIACFKNEEELQSALIGDPRRRIQVDLLESYKILRCSCCTRSDKNLLPSMHDTSIMYKLVQEHGDIINLHDWYQSFKSIVVCSRSKGKSKSRQSPSIKKRKVTNQPDNHSEASIQARFCRAVMELQITGLIRMPTKRRPDYVQRVAFGL